MSDDDESGDDIAFELCAGGDGNVGIDRYGRVIRARRSWRPRRNSPKEDGEVHNSEGAEAAARSIEAAASAIMASASEVETQATNSADIWSTTADQQAPSNNNMIVDNSNTRLEACPSLKALRESIIRLSPEEIDRESSWTIWELQEALNGAFPQCIKRIAKPEECFRPVKLIRYTTEVKNAKLSGDPNILGDKETIVDNEGQEVVSMEKMVNMRRSVGAPSEVMWELSRFNHTGLQGYLYCRICGRPDCERFLEGRNGCRKMRCAFCYKPGHSLGKCRQSAPYRWNQEYLAHIEETYRNSIDYKVPYKGFCILCGNQGHRVCVQNPLMTDIRKAKYAFEIYSRDDIIRDLARIKGTWPSQIPWDIDSTLLDNVRGPPNRYSIREMHDYYHSNSFHARTSGAPTSAAPVRHISTNYHRSYSTGPRHRPTRPRIIEPIVLDEDPEN